MKVHHGEGVAIRTGPEPCVGTREGVDEASVGEHIGQPLSRENLSNLGADVFESTEGNTDGSDNASRRPTRRGPRPWHVWTLFAREPGDLGFGQRRTTAGPHREDEESKPMMHEPEKSDFALVHLAGRTNSILAAAHAASGLPVMVHLNGLARVRLK